MIRDAQLQALQRSLDRRFAQSLAVVIRQRFPRQSAEMNDPSLLDVVLTHVREAELYGITHPYAVTDYVGLKFELGFAFDRHPMVAELLQDRSIDGEKKLRMLSMSMTERDWAEVRRFCSELESG